MIQNDVIELYIYIQDIHIIYMYNIMVLEVETG